MKQSNIVGEEQSHEDGVTGVTELNGDEDAALYGLTTALRDALYALRAQQMGEGARQIINDEQGDEGGLVCPQCGGRVWVEGAENGRRILVNNDGSPHRDACPQPEGVRQILWPFDPFTS